MTTWRRRQCLQCKALTTSIESVDLASAFRVRTEAALAPFSRDILFVSIYESCKHRKTALQDATELTATIITTLPTIHKKSVIEHSDLVQTIHQTLQRFDTIAATLYLAFHPYKA